MTRITGPFATPLLGAVPVQVRAHPGSENGYGHMMWGGGFGLLGALMMLLFWARSSSPWCWPCAG